jgi:hypothetical protein
MANDRCTKCGERARSGKHRWCRECQAAARKAAREAQDGERAYLLRELDLRGIQAAGEPDVAELKRLLAAPVAVVAAVTAPAAPVRPPEPEEAPTRELTYTKASYAAREPKKALRGQTVPYGENSQALYSLVRAEPVDESDPVNFRCRVHNTRRCAISDCQSELIARRKVALGLA